MERCGPDEQTAICVIVFQTGTTWFQTVRSARWMCVGVWVCVCVCVWVCVCVCVCVGVCV